MKRTVLSYIFIVWSSVTALAQNAGYWYYGEDDIKQYGTLHYYRNDQQAEQPTPIVRNIRLSTGVQLEYAEQGNEKGIPVILIHGFPDSRKSYDRVMPLFPSTWHVFSLSLRGFGESEKPATGYSPKDIAKDVAAFITAQKLQKVIIVGHSVGATVAQQFCIDHPEKTAAIALIGALNSFKDKPALVEFFDYCKTLKDPVDKAFVEAFQRSTIYKDITDEFYVTIIEESMKVPAHVWAGIADGFKNSDSKSGIASIQQPVLLLWGTKDSIAPRGDQDAIKSAIKNSRLIVYEEIGHDVQWEHPEQFAKDLVNFINTVKI